MSSLNPFKFSQIIFRHAKNIHTNVSVASFKSSISLDKLYPGSSLDLTKKLDPPKTEGLNFSGYIPMDEVDVTYSRSGGPGGQHVNKINTKVDLRFQLDKAQWLSPELRTKVAEKYPSSLTGEGFLVVRSDKTRSQQLNLADALDKLRHMIHTAAFTPRPPSAEAVERHRRRHEAAVRDRLRKKRDRSAVKQGRQEPTMGL